MRLVLQLPHKATPFSVETIGVTPELCSASYVSVKVFVVSMLRVFLTSGERYARQFLSRRFFVQLFSWEVSSRCTVRFWPVSVAFGALKLRKPPVAITSSADIQISFRKLITETI